MKSIHKNIWCAMMLALFSSFTVSAQQEIQEDKRVQKIVSQLEKYYFDYPQEKVYLHLDKDQYKTGERIWIKAYLVNGTTHKPAVKSANLYVELLNSDKEAIHTKRFKLDDGFAKGDFLLNDTIREGYYHIRAFTSWMNNFDNSLIPNYTVYVRNENYKDFITKDKLRYNKRMNRKIERSKEKVDVQFFPEGGELIDNIPTKVAFKAINGLGEGIDVKGAVYNKEDQKITEFNSLHKGMGFFWLEPKGKMKYYALIENDNEKFDLPEVMEHGAIMSIDNSDENDVAIELKANLSETVDPNAAELILIGHTRGDVKHAEVFSVANLPLEINVTKDKFRSGVTHFTLFNDRSQPVAERLIFIDKEDDLHFRVEQNMSNSFDQQASFDINAVDSEGRAVRSNLSVSVKTNNRPEELNTFDGNIKTTMLLTSDIRGYVEEPTYYFSQAENAKKALDILLLTQGWRRFNWENIIAGNFPEISNPRETGIALTGRITRQFFSIPYANSRVELYVMDEYNDVFTTYSDDDGYFKFDNLNYRDTINLEIYAYKPNGKRNLVIELEEGNLPDVELEKLNYDRFVASKGIARYKLEAQKKQSQTEEDDDEFEQPEHHKIHGDPDYVVTADQIPSGYSNLFDVLKGRVPGLAVSGNSINIRGVNSIMLSNEPLYLLDGVPIDASGVSGINPQDVDRIEILSGPSSAIYGSRGANGVIAIYTKRGKFMKKGFLDFQMLGYYTPKEFYQPKFSNYNSVNEFRNANPTIFWEPDIRTTVGGSASVSFKIPEFEFPMQIEIEGVSYDGKVGVQKKEIQIR
jgi:TonB-dependent SusC/RagA subfamily outer membrane receptor